MSVHSLLDLLSVRLAAVPTGRAKFFRDGVDSPSLPDLVRSVSLDLPTISGEGVYEVRARTGPVELDPAFEVAQWRGAGYPTLLYHHGNNERPFDRALVSKNSFKRVVWESRGDFDANLIVLRAPLHRSFTEYRRGVAQLAGFARMLAASARLIEHLRAWCRDQRCSPFIVSGISLGGWVTNLHRACFNSADAYAPLLAGAALDHVFVSSAYRRLTASSALESPDKLHLVLNFETEFARVPDDNVYPLLARHDEIIVFDRQKQCYGGRTMRVLDKGHVTAALATRELRRHLLGVLGRTPKPDEEPRDHEGPAPQSSRRNVLSVVLPGLLSAGAAAGYTARDWSAFPGPISTPAYELATESVRTTSGDGIIHRPPGVVPRTLRGLGSDFSD